MENVKREFLGVWFPAEIWLTKELTWMEKLFLIEIQSLDKTNHCWATNSHFSEMFGLSKKRCSVIINKLVEKGCVKSEIKRDESGVVLSRILTVNIPILENKGTPLPRNRDTLSPETGIPYPRKQGIESTMLEYHERIPCRDKKKRDNSTPSLPSSPEEIELYAHENGYEGIGEAFYRYYNNLGWKDKNGKPVKNWKAKCRNVWFTEERKIKPKKPIHYGLPEELQKSIDAGESA